MKIGTVRALEGGLAATLEIELRWSAFRSGTFNALLDTGFNGAVSLPIENVAELGLPLVREQTVTLGDASDVRVMVHAGRVRFADGWHRCPVLATGDVPLVGMQLLQGVKVCFEAVDGGDVEAVSISAKGN